MPCTEVGRRGVVRRGRCAVRPGPGARLLAPRGPRRFVSGVFGFVCSRCVRFLVKTSHSVRICIPSPIPFGFGANRYDWGNWQFPQCVRASARNGLTQSKRRPAMRSTWRNTHFCGEYKREYAHRSGHTGPCLAVLPARSVSLSRPPKQVER